MAYAPQRLGRVAIKEQSGWGTAATGFAASSVIECEVVIPPLVQEALTTDVMRAGFNQPTIVAGSKAGAEVTLTGALHGLSATTPSADPTEHPDAMLMRYALGASSQDGYEASCVGADTTSYDSATSAVDAHRGHAVLIPQASGYAVGWVHDVDSATYDLSNVLPANSASGTVLGSNTCYLTTDTPANGLSLEWLGADDTAALVFYDGLVTSYSITTDTKNQPRFSVTLRFGSWTNTGTGGAPAPAGYAYPQMPAVIGASGARMLLGGASTCLGSFNFAVEVEVSEAACWSGNQGVAQYVVTNRTVSIETTGPVSDASSLAAPGDDPGYLEADLNTTPGRALSIYIPEPRVLEQQQLGDSNNLLGVTTKYGAAFYDGYAVDTVPSNTTVRVAFL